jgi:hypothetical protein
MKKALCFCAAVFLLIGPMATASKADSIRFTAVGYDKWYGQPTGYGGYVFGYVEYDYPSFLSVIQGASQWNAVFAPNSDITAMWYHDPGPNDTHPDYSLSDVNTTLPPGASTFAFMLDSNGVPFVMGGGAWLAQVLTCGGITEYGLAPFPNDLNFRWGGRCGMDPYINNYHAYYVTSIVPSPSAPEPASVVLFGSGLLAIGAMARSMLHRRRA